MDKIFEKIVAYFKELSWTNHDLFLGLWHFIFRCYRGIIITPSYFITLWNNIWLLELIILEIWDQKNGILQ